MTTARPPSVHPVERARARGEWGWCLGLLLVCLALFSCDDNKPNTAEGAGGAGNLGTGGPCSPPGAYRCSPDDARTLEVCDPATSTDWLPVETCASPELCSPEEGACLSCTPGEFQCMAWELQQCDRKGSAWELRDTCENEKYCDRLGAQCAVCLAGATYCGGENLSTLYVCDPGRTGYLSTTCDRPGDCSTTSMTCRSCIEGEYQCNKSDLQRCNAAQEWEVQATCASDALCQKSRDLLLVDTARAPTCEAPACTQGTYKCDEDDGRNLLGCPPSQDEWTVVDVCATTALCEQGVAAGVCPAATCDPGTPRCEGLALQVCNADGTEYDTTQTCASSDQCNLLEMDCVPCTPGTVQCNGAMLQKCSADKTWVTEAVCDSASLCVSNAESGAETGCVDSVCPDSQYRCEGAELQLCNPDQLGWTAVKTCDSVALCNATDARCDTTGCPSAGQTRCQDNALQVCPESLSDWMVQEQCSAGSVCDLALPGCADTCPDPPYRCNNTQPEHCVETEAGAAWEVVSAPCATAALCQASADGASCLTAACGGALPDYRCSGQVVEHCNAGRTGWETALTCAMGSVCDPGPSREGPPQCDVCGADAYVCDGGNLMRCEPNGQSQATVANCRDAAHCVAGGDADNSYCKICDPDETQCNGSKLDTCAENQREWIEQDDCGANGCHEGAGAADYCNACPEAGATECADETHLITCSDDQTSWSEPQECPFGCQANDAGAYCRECEPSTIDCSPDAETERRVCDDEGHWGAYAACPDDSQCFTSDDGDYCGSCDPGSSMCVSSSEQVSCGDDGVPAAATTCPMGTPYCLGASGECVQCNPSGAPECTGASGSAGRRTCSTAGAWEQHDCATMGSTVCLNGNCVACTPNAAICPAGSNASARQVCSAMGVWADQACTASGLLTCYQGNCVECNPNTDGPRCTGMDTAGRQTCDSTGHWTPINSTADDCTGGNICVAGVCQACNPATQPAECVAPTPGSGRRQCSMGSWADVSCVAPTPVCSSSSGMAATCVCLNGDHACNSSVLQTCSMGAWANDPGSPACTACTGNGMCAGQTPACNGEWCVQCTASSHALCTGNTPICSATNTCRACTEGECGASAVCDTQTGACVECVDADASACPPATPVCSNKECVQCTAGNADACTGDTPICDASNVCRACEDTDECPDGTTCDVSGACVE